MAEAREEGREATFKVIDEARNCPTWWDDSPVRPNLSISLPFSFLITLSDFSLLFFFCLMITVLRERLCTKWAMLQIECCLLGSIPTEVKRFFLYLLWFPESLY